MKGRPNMVTKYFVGETYNTLKGQMRILERIPGKTSKDGIHHHPRCVVRMLATGTVLSVQTTNIASGKFTDYRLPSVYGVGYIGSELKIPARGAYVRRVYDLWANMLKRAYGEYKDSYKGCTVDKRWHNFTNFINTLPQLTNYQHWEQGENYVLDKDIKIHGNKTYSLETCQFVPSSENIAESANRRWHGTNDPVLT